MKDQVQVKSENKEFKSNLKFKASVFKPIRRLIKEIEGAVIQKTTDYDMFDGTFYSRTVKSTHTRKLAKSMANYGQLIPIIVIKAKKDSPFKYRILEGHHRWHAAQMYNVPLYFVVYEFVDDNAEKEFYSTVNVLSKKLSDVDYLKMGVELGKPSYILIQKIMDEEGFSFLDLTKLLSLKGNMHFKNCTYNLSTIEKERLHTKIKQYKEIVTSTEYVASLSNFDTRSKKMLRAAIVRVIKYPQYDHQRMLKKLNAYGTDNKILSVKTGKVYSTVIHYIDQLEKIYNKGEKGDNVLLISRMVN